MALILIFIKAHVLTVSNWLPNSIVWQLTVFRILQAANSRQITEHIPPHSSSLSDLIQSALDESSSLSKKNNFSRILTKIIGENYYQISTKLGI